MNKYKNDKNINIERENKEVNVEKLQIFGPRSKPPPSCTLTADLACSLSPVQRLLDSAEKGLLAV